MPIRRLPDYDYSSAGAYFVTICTRGRSPLFESEELADAVRACWTAIPAHFDAELDVFVVMPDHVHGILVLPWAGHARPLQTIVGSFKSAAAREVNRRRGTPGALVWQRGYFERVVRDENELEALREYVADNPAACGSTATPSAPWL